MSFLLIEISCEAINFWGYPEKGTPEMLICSGESTVPPYVANLDGDLKINAWARQQFKKNNPSAFGNFAVNPDKKVDFKGDKRTIAELFFLGLDNLLANSSQSELASAYNQKTLPLRFWFSPKLQGKILEFWKALEKLGFTNFAEINQNQLLCDTFNVKTDAIVLTGADGDLVINHFYLKNSNNSGSKELIGEGSDPRIQILSGLIFKDIKRSDGYLNEKNELPLIIDLAVKLLEEDKTFYLGDFHSSEGQSYGFRIKNSDIDKELKFRSTNAKIFAEIDNLSKETGNSYTSNTPVFLVGDAICTVNFTNQISEKYSKVYSLNKTSKKDFLRILLAKEKENNFEPPSIEKEENPELKRLISEGDKYFTQGNLTLAKYRYEDALKIDSSNEHCINRVSEIEKQGRSGGKNQVEIKEKCPLCNESFPKDELVVHVSSCSPKKEKCPLCKESFPKNELVSHVSSCSPKKEKCPLCNESFSKNELVSHVSSCTAKKETCPLCKESFPKNELVSHVSSCTPKKETCPLCKKTFPKNQLVSHVSSCKGVKPIVGPPLTKCSICGEKFTIPALKAHKKVCKGGTSSKIETKNTPPVANPPITKPPVAKPPVTKPPVAKSPSAGPPPLPKKSGPPPLPNKNGPGPGPPPLPKK